MFILKKHLALYLERLGYEFVAAFFKKKLYGLFLCMGFNCLKARATSRRQFTFYHLSSQNSLYSFYPPSKDDGHRQPWSHPVVLNMGHY